MTSVYIFFFQNDKTNTIWTPRPDSCRTVELKSADKTALLMDSLNADTFYKVEVRAHNDIGYSVPSEIVFKTAMGKYATLFSGGGGGKPILKTYLR